VAWTRLLYPVIGKTLVLLENYNQISNYIILIRYLGESLNLVRIWHDNSGRDSNASWFLKYLIITDLSSRLKFYFICDDWLAVDKSDGSLQRVLSSCGDKQKLDLKYLINKQTKMNMSDNHLWFSLWAKPVTSTFSRLQRLTCCFVLLCLSMLMNIVYYQSKQNSTTDNPNSLKIGEMTLTPEQVILYFLVFFKCNIRLIIFKNFIDWNRNCVKSCHISPYIPALGAFQTFQTSWCSEQTHVRDFETFEKSLK
jgi:succinate dehydrogenase/fumarate reductase cytochrome b subunit